MAAGVKDVDSVEDFKKLLADAGGNLVVVHFAAQWAPQCKQMTDVMSELSKDNQLKQVQFVQLEAEKLAEISEKNNITAVPTFIFFKGGKSVDRLDGAKAADLTKKVKNLSSGVMTASPPPQTQKQDLNTRLKQLINSAPVILFMKGSKQEPRCGFSRQMIQILNDKNVIYSTFDILSDEEVRQGLKTFSNWPTYPQLYANGELLGGLDIVKELVESGELESQLPVQIKLEDRLSSQDSPQPPSPSHNTSTSMCCSDALAQFDDKKDTSDNTHSLEVHGNETSISSDLHHDGTEDLHLDGFTVTVNMSEEEEEEEENEEDDNLPLWFSSDSCDTPRKSSSQGRGRKSRRGKKKSLDARRHDQKLIQRERRALIRSDPSLLAAQKEKERLRQMMIRRRDSLILSLPVDPNMSIEDANLMLMEQQREAGVPEEDITSLQLGRENFSTIGELKRKIEGKRALDRERTRMKRAQLDDKLREEMKRTCRERMREKRARIRQCDPAAAAAHREREKIRKRIERRRNAMLLSLPQETIVSPTEGGDSENGPSLLPETLSPEFSSAIMILRENLLRKRQEQKEKVRQRRAELRKNHPDIAAAIRERERVRKQIERRRNSLLLKLSPESLLKVTQKVMNQDSSSSSDASQPFHDYGMSVGTGPLQSQVLQLNLLDRADEAVPLTPTDSTDIVETPPSSHTPFPNTSAADVSGSTFEGGLDWASNIDKLKRSIQDKKDYNKERMRLKRAKLKEDPDAFEAMKEKERLRKKMERLKKKGTNPLNINGTPLTFSYDNPQTESSATGCTSVGRLGEETCSDQESEQNTNSLDNVIIKQEPPDEDEGSNSKSVDFSLPSDHQLHPPQDINMMKENYTDSLVKSPDGSENISAKILGSEVKYNSAEYYIPRETDMQVCGDIFTARPDIVNISKNVTQPEHNLKTDSDNSKEEMSGQRGNIEKCTAKNHLSNLPSVSMEVHGHTAGPKEGTKGDDSFRHSKSSPPTQQKELQHLQASWQNCKSETEDSATVLDNRNKDDIGSTGPVDIPSFSSVEEERDWFQTQLCRLQTRVTDTTPEPTNTSVQQLEESPRGLCNTNYIPLESPSMTSLGCLSKPVGPLSVNSFSDISKLTVAMPQKPVPAADYLSGIAEVTLRTSLEQMTALAGPEVMQDRLRQMVQSAKEAREKANEQARRRREKLRRDPAMKQKYEEIKAKDMERKRQQRAKEAEIRTVFPSFNEERRIKDRERKKLNRSKSKELCVNTDRTSVAKDGCSPAIDPFVEHGVRTATVGNLPSSGLILPPVGASVGLPALSLSGLGGAANNYLTSVYANCAVTPQGHIGPKTQIQPPYIPQLEPPETHSNHQPDVKPHISQNHRLAS